ncbi:hypothetical protein RIF23_19770 [Lipingzhangella sp. LS1_29]|uniref:SPW repeat-containing protein n=1 Tax=Lipingzhangella rawalii TaxID=2055835 RepID=A0ABU2HB30_9ACTN|nr:hypothetical protein [Lipingzhangella rawalii]MDS1272531.1 hypothetical protein [Lipingzhangella rawalii]
MPAAVEHSGVATALGCQARWPYRSSENEGIMARRYRVATLAAAILLTMVGSPIVVALGGDTTIAPVALIGAILTWAACLWCWGVAGRPYWPHLVIIPVVQLLVAFFVGFVGATVLSPTRLDREWASFLAVWLICAGMYTVASALLAGFARDYGTGSPGGGGDGGGGGA